MNLPQQKLVVRTVQLKENKMPSKTEVLAVVENKTTPTAPEKIKKEEPQKNIKNEQLPIKDTKLQNSQNTKPVKKESVKNSNVSTKKPLEKKAPLKKETLKKTPPKKETAKVVPKEKDGDPVKQQPSPSKEENAVQAAAQAKKQALLAKAQESIAKIDQSRAKIVEKSTSTSLSLAPEIKDLHIDTAPAENGQLLNTMEVRYQDELASRLKLQLKLPERGEVKIKLILERSGKVKNVVIVKSQSLINQQYIEQRLPLLKFPGFGTNFGSSSDHTFVISLRNEF